MLQKNETPEQNDSSLETSMHQKVAMTAPFSTPVTANGMPYQGYTIIQHFHPPASPPLEQPYSSCQKNLIIDEILEFLWQFSQLSLLERDTVIKMVKDSSITAPITAKILKVVLAALKLTPGQWQAVLEIVKSGSLPAPVESDGKITVIINSTRTMTEESFGKLKSSIISSSSFKEGAEKTGLVESLEQIRMMTPEEFASLREGVKDYSSTTPTALKKEVKKILTQLGQLTIVQVDVILKMVKDSSIT